MSHVADVIIGAFDQEDGGQRVEARSDRAAVWLAGFVGADNVSTFSDTGGSYVTVAGHDDVVTFRQAAERANLTVVELA